ncbi:molybdopterin-guanine dinucleotide biosynthesis protein MobB [Motiliproteus sediminis]|uniref:molybdopterin-guanine dinucleotide biosynthesis protein MobB n=1 Tax=Motiliproteus sediminis TaxID=1468178 RepID=UPI001AEF36E4|nr:molybdopterin-guanine dinucleotide biosynthesis protein MobB [Motiliproteus sediminis]
MTDTPITSPLPLIGFAAYSGTGKTTLLTRLLPVLAARGIRAAVIKHAHHRFEVDHAGKDSYELRKAGAAQMLIGSRHRWALMTETPYQEEPDLNYLIAQLDPALADLIIVEGLKREAFPKIELHRPSTGQPLMFPDNRNIVAVATDEALARETRLPLLDINDVNAIADFVIQFCQLQHKPSLAL